MSRQKEKRISFEAWIEREGVDVLTKRLGVNRFTILNWRARRCDPQVRHMKRIKAVSRGEIGYEQMIERQQGERT